MDTDELDAWLGTAEVPDRDATAPGSARPTRTGALDPREPGGGRERSVPWLRIGAIGGAVWLLVAVVVLRGGPAEEAEQVVPLPGDAPAASVGGTSATDAAAPTADAPADPAADPEALPPTEATGPGAGAPGTAAGGDGGTGPDGAAHRRAEASAVLALREAMATGGEEDHRYLEWAIPVASVVLSEEAVAVVLDAVWLVGDGTTFEGARRGRWAVPVTIDGRQLAEPWPLAGEEVPPPDDLPPPVLRQRVDEAAGSLTDLGWTDVVVQGSEPHPELPLVWRAIVDGTDPTGRVRVAATVWFEDIDGLRVIGSDR